MPTALCTFFLMHLPHPESDIVTIQLKQCFIITDNIQYFKSLSLSSFKVHWKVYTRLLLCIGFSVVLKMFLHFTTVLWWSLFTKTHHKSSDNLSRVSFIPSYVIYVSLSCGLFIVHFKDSNLFKTFDLSICDFRILDFKVIYVVIYVSFLVNCAPIQMQGLSMKQSCLKFLFLRDWYS